MNTENGNTNFCSESGLQKIAPSSTPNVPWTISKTVKNILSNQQNAEARGEYKTEFRALEKRRVTPRPRISITTHPAWLRLRYALYGFEYKPAGTKLPEQKGY